MKLKEKIARLQRAAPNISKFGQLYQSKAETTGAYKRITLHTLFKSDEGTHLLRPHVFNKKTPMNAAQWHAWLAENLTAIHKDAVLPGIAIRTSKSWAVERILGWTADVKHKPRNPPVDRRRNKAKRKRSKGG